MNIFVVYDQNGNILTAADSYPSTVTPPSQLLVLDGSDPLAQAVLANKHAYVVQNGQIVSATTIQFSVARTTNLPWDEFTITASASDNSAQTLNVSVLGFNDALTTGVPYVIRVHQAIMTNEIEAVVTGSGVVTNRVALATGGSKQSLQTYKDADGVLHIAPTSKNDLVAFYTAQVPPELSTADLTTADSMLMQAVFGIIVPALVANNTITLDANQTNAVNDLTANVLPNIVTTLETAAPVPATGASQTFDLHYGSYRRDIQIAKNAFDQYAQDVQTIPNLV